MPPPGGIKQRSATSHLKAGVAPNKGSGRWRVTFSQESDGGDGACGPIGSGGMWYSELSTNPGGPLDFAALGNLPCGTVLNFENPANGKTATAAKRDKGAGSSFLPVGGVYPALGRALGLDGSGKYDLIISRADGGPLAPVRGTPVGGNTNPGTGATPAGSGGSSSSPSILGIGADVFALFSLVIIKDVVVGVGDYVVVPFWHWNQRAMTRYREQILFDPKGHPLAMPATAAFWGLGYVLLFTDPNSGKLKPAPVRNSRLAHHVRRLQALPARRSLIKPKNVQGKTPVKPPTVTSRARVAQVGTLQATRSSPVRISGNIRNQTNGNGTRSETRIERAGALPGSQGNEATAREEATRVKPDAQHRTWHDPLPASGRSTQDRPRSRR